MWFSCTLAATFWVTGVLTNPQNGGIKRVEKENLPNIRVSADLTLLDDELTEDDIRVRERVKSGVEFSDGAFGLDPSEESVQWPSGDVPYKLDSIKFDAQFLTQFHAALDEFHSKTCIRFRPFRPGDRFFVKIVKADGCWSYVGLQRDLIDVGQELSLSEECWRKGIIVHELTHALGFFHEHSRFDRDNFITLNLDNIQRNRVRQFDKRSRQRVDEIGDYDLFSILHYEQHAFAINKRIPTIVPKLRSARAANMGQRKFLSAGDVAKIINLYNCSKSNVFSYKMVQVPLAQSSDSPTSYASFHKLPVHKNVFYEIPFIGNRKGGNMWKVNKGVPFASLDDFRTRTGRQDPPMSLAQRLGWHVKQNNSVPIPTSFRSLSPQMIQCPTVAAGNCMDRRDDCFLKALDGLCEQKPGLMLRMCRRSCCNCDGSRCFDTLDRAKFNTLCAGGACLQAVEAVRQNAHDFCPKTCGSCN